MHTLLPIYYAGFEVGSGFSGLKLIPADGLTLAQDLITLPSFLADGDMSTLLKGVDPEATLADILQQEEYVLSFQDRTYFLGHLLEHGTHSTNAFSDERRYWSEHAQILLLCLACILVPERCFELRLVTALPVSLYDRTRRQQVRQALSQHYRFSFNGRAREVNVKCGYVAMEGQGILIHCGDVNGSQAVIDIGERTTDLVAANGQRLLVRLCKGEQFGVGQLVEEVQQLGQRYRRKLSIEKVHALLTAYAHHRPYPRIPMGTGLIPDDEITEVIQGAIGRVARPLSSFVVGAWNVEAHGLRNELYLISEPGERKSAFRQRFQLKQTRVSSINFAPVRAHEKRTRDLDFPSLCLVYPLSQRQFRDIDYDTYFETDNKEDISPLLSHSLDMFSTTLITTVREVPPLDFLPFLRYSLKQHWHDLFV